MPNQGSGEQPSYPSETLHNGPAVIACLPRAFGDDFVWKGLRLVMLGPEREREKSAPSRLPRKDDRRSRDCCNIGK